MASKDRQQRRAKRLARQKRKRAHVSRPGRDAGGTVAAPNLKTALGWPVGDCYLSEGWDEPGAHLHAVFARSHADGRSVAAFVEIDRTGPGIVDAHIATFGSAEAVLSECIRISEAEGELAFRGAPPGVVAGAIVDARTHGSESPDSWERVESLLHDVEPAEMDAPFGPAPEVKQKSGLLDRLFRLLG